MADKEYISYEEITNECKKLAMRLKSNGFNKIIAVTRGGMVPACLLAQFLDIREISSISLVSYSFENKCEEIKCLVSPGVVIDNQTLFVDDLYDSGQTYSFMKDTYPQAKAVVIYSKNNRAKLDFPAVEKNADTWLVFPWEFEPVP